MEKHEHHVIKLLRNRRYPTYQLYAEMASKKTSPQDGLRLAALTVMQWLRERLGDDIPVELAQKDPEEYLNVSDECLKSLHMSCGFVVDIVSLPEQGIWTLQITEPDLGSDPGNPAQRRPPVPGRVIETNIGFHVAGMTLECGFQSVFSDPEVASTMGEVYRLAVVRRLMKNPDFGLKQISTLSIEAERVHTVEQAKRIIAAGRDKTNQLPLVVFTNARKEATLPEPPPRASRPMQYEMASSMPKLNLAPKAKGNVLPIMEERKPAKAKKREISDGKSQLSAEPYLPYDVDAFANSVSGFCRTILLADELLDRFNSMSGASLCPGDILVMEPSCFEGEQKVFPFAPSKTRQTELLDELTEAMMNYPREKPYNFGGVTFISSARQNLMESSRDALQQSEVVAQRYALDVAMERERWNASLAEKESECSALQAQLGRQREYQERIEKEKDELRQVNQREQAKLKQVIEDRDQTISYLQRKLSQPREHAQIAAWISENFAGRLLLHPKAVGLLEDKSAQGVDVGLICDALDFLATDFWDNRYLRISVDEMNMRCSEKYGRRFEITPTGENTINYTPSQYKIKYYKNPRTGKPMESGLDYHLRVGSDPENLLRIYFLLDDEKKQVVVGSLPRHLRAITIK